MKFHVGSSNLNCSYTAISTISSACLPGFSVTFLVQSIYTDYENKVFFNKISQENSILKLYPTETKLEWEGLGVVTFQN